ncbi:MAG: DUF5040 domain-containing protein [Alistipes sp.]|nr:DUF5040 domain-containing protein [Candidatus Alistipes equi]
MSGILMIGASIVYPENTWFELACETLCVDFYKNNAISGTSIRDDAVKLAAGDLERSINLDDFSILAIDHVHNVNVLDERELLDDYTKYNVSLSMSYTQAFDYVIRRYIDICKELEFNPQSRWYGIKGGKPVHIMLCTYWHDARVAYNESVRRLQQKWKDIASICRFDEKIGFSKDDFDPVTGEHASIKYAKNNLNDTEVIDGVVYGWHPTRGRNAGIQQKMANIFVEEILLNYSEIFSE